MFGTGTIINVCAIIIGGSLGLIAGKWIPNHCQEMILRIMGTCVLLVGISGVLEQMIVIHNSTITTKGTMMMVISMSLGCLVGEVLNLEGRIENFGCWLREKSGHSGDKYFLEAFICTTMTVGIGAMAVVGAVQDGIYGDNTTLVAKSLMDFVIVLVMASSMGKGCIFSAIPVAILQGSITLLAHFIEPLLTITALSNLSMVGSALIFCVGVNLIWENTFRLANLLPSLIIAILYMW